ncbi:hypothetical protein ACK3SF_04215 [Candidatus Nanosalina sp. VS9-1]|uniref:hypothetical protein n=1 Tax=Candidatus Nanosalina sp. VS9-1 TaxID=3388566 RepID=UPI0039DF3B36
MSRDFDSQHTDAVEDLANHFSPFLNDDRVRWDSILIEESNPSKHLDTEASLEREVDLALVNGTEAFVLEVKTTRNDNVKAERQVDDIIDFFEEAGYDVWGTYYLDERTEHMDSAELAHQIHENFGGVFDKDDLETIIDYQNTWGSFGYIKSFGSRDLTDVDPYRTFHVENAPYDLDILTERGVVESEAERVYRFTDECKEFIENGEEDSIFMLQPKAYEKFGI